MKLRSIAQVAMDSGFDPRRLKHLKYTYKYVREAMRFIKLGGKVAHFLPILSDYDKEAGTLKQHYFQQDLHVASLVYRSNPARHIDVGSRLDGFVAHLAVFRVVEVMDVRPLSAPTITENIQFLRADLMNPEETPIEITDSLSCLHAIEHFGLGRYRDNIDPLGHVRGFNNLLKMLKPQGTLYISFPIANSSRVDFNAHRVFGCADILEWAEAPNRIALKRFDYIDDAGTFHADVSIHSTLPKQQYGCGIYTFTKF
jgi:hypothetical protein